MNNRRLSLRLPDRFPRSGGGRSALASQLASQPTGTDVDDPEPYTRDRESGSERGELWEASFFDRDKLRQLLIASPTSLVRRVFLDDADTDTDAASCGTGTGTGTGRESRDGMPCGDKLPPVPAKSAAQKGKKATSKAKSKPEWEPEWEPEWTVDFDTSKWLVLSSLFFLGPMCIGLGSGVALPQAGLRLLGLGGLAGHLRSLDAAPSAMTCALSLISAMTAFISSLHWWSARERSLRRAMDMFWCKVSGLVYALIGCIYARTDVAIWLLGAVGFLLMGAMYRLASQHFFGGNSYWFLFHMLFHLCVVGSQVLVLHAVLAKK